ncbi:sigma E protease regulator RseP [Candidatus Schneideria nysicola]|uniref:sigma E protease regulator RseP n=1 Tax=Candidatus Schneideria nysicola TaxID=1081631 RepID=UPI001CAA496D|nr:sigma E protease regulator RseP [Candidatus Schneideria nysicola]UAJ64978.1 sigma E protease regulator RseP [Candidatus Schneideria nysicola]
MLHIIWIFFTFTLTLSMLILVHELGHFLVARYYGVKVERFSIGFGYPLLRKRDKFDTEYILSAIPLGGYVKMFGAGGESISHENSFESFNNKPIWQRCAITSAGSICNIMFAFAIYWLVFMIGIPDFRPILTDILPESIIARANILPGMEIKSVNGINTPSWSAVRHQLMKVLKNNEQIYLDVSNNSNPLTIQRKFLELSLKDHIECSKKDPLITLGINPIISHIEPIIKTVQAGSAAEKAGLQPNDKIMKVEEKNIDHWSSFVMSIKNSPGKKLRLKIERNKTILELILIPDSQLNQHNYVEGFAGLTPTVIPISNANQIVNRYDPLSALYKAGEASWNILILTMEVLTEVIGGNAKLSSLSGPISIAHGAYLSAENGLIHYLMFLSLISINLGIMNLLPIPILDGGRLLFLMIEKIRSKPIEESVQERIYQISSIILMVLMALAIFNDISKLR